MGLTNQPTSTSFLLPNTMTMKSTQSTSDVNVVLDNFQKHADRGLFTDSHLPCDMTACLCSWKYQAKIAAFTGYEEDDRCTRMLCTGPASEYLCCIVGPIGGWCCRGIYQASTGSAVLRNQNGITYGHQILSLQHCVCTPCFLKTDVDFLEALQNAGVQPANASSLAPQRQVMSVTEHAGPGMPEGLSICNRFGPASTTASPQAATASPKASRKCSQLSLAETLRSQTLQLASAPATTD